MKNTYIKQLLAAILLLCCTVASAETYSGTCGENVTWSLNTASRVLNITGLGEMTNYSSSTSVPWYDYRETITSVVIGDGVTTIGKIAFRGCSGLTSVTIPNSVTTIEDGVFGGCI